MPAQRPTGLLPTAAGGLVHLIRLAGSDPLHDSLQTILPCLRFLGTPHPAKVLFLSPNSQLAHK